MSQDTGRRGEPTGATRNGHVIRMSQRRFDAQALVASARRAQRIWAARPIPERLATIARLRESLAEHAAELAATIVKRPVADSLSGEILPMLEACRYLERHAEKLLRRTRRRGRIGIWLRGTEVDVLREPHGVVLVIGPSNYGLMLAGIQALQALAAGNAVIVKPAPAESAALMAFAVLLERSGLPKGLFSVVDESVESAYELIDSVVDRVVFTGSSTAGRAVIERAGELLIPVTAELSGWDAALILDDADLDRAADAIAFSLAFNAGRTCLAPRRVLVTAAGYDALIAKLIAALEHVSPVEHDAATTTRLRMLVPDALSQGAVLAAGTLDDDSAAGPILLTGVTAQMQIFSSEVFGSIAMVTLVGSEADAVVKANQTPYGLGASIFGSRARAQRIATALDAGVVMINDAVVPAAHPALPIAPRGASGFGVTRGPEGLLAMTRPKAIAVGQTRRPLHLKGLHMPAASLSAYIKAAYGHGAWARMRAALDCLRSLADTRASGRADAKAKKNAHRSAPTGAAPRTAPSGNNEHSREKES